MEEFHTTIDMLRYVKKNYSNPTALNRRENEHWHSLSTEEFLQNVKYLALGLHQYGLRRGDCVGILAHPSPEWTIAELAILAVRGIVVPLFANISDENFVYQVNQTRLKIIFVEGGDQWLVFEQHADIFDIGIAFDKHSHQKKIGLAEVFEAGKKLNELRPQLYDEMENEVQREDLAAIIYTSGSTGVPKGVELTQESLVGILNFSDFNWKIKNDRYLSVLPLAHIFGHCINLWMITWGISVYYSNDYKNLGVICRELKPTAIVVVPRLLEKIYLKIADQIHHSQGFRRWIGEWAIKLARKKPSWMKKLLFPIANLLVYKKLRQALGGKLRVVLSGGAALNPFLQNFFNQIGVPVYEGYGLTEACPLSVNRPGKNKIGTVGQAVLGQKLKISPEGELLAKGNLVMKGYYLNPEATTCIIDEEGWLHTGDRCKIDEEGYLTLFGRMKELYKTSTGEYVAPLPIEQALTSHPLIEMAMVIAEGKKFTSCLLFPNLEILSRLKTEQKAQGISDDKFLLSTYIRKEIDNLLKDVNKHLNHWEEVHDYRFVLDPLSIQNGEITPSMKIRREVVAKKYSHLINSMYQEEEK